MKVITRFAPSPTGYLHIGGARTALFNWLFARKNKGKFILRIEDTDRARSTEESTRKILEDLRWLGLDWDEGPEVGGPNGPYFQSQRLTIYQEYANKLIEKNLAYRCFESAEQLRQKREEAKRAGKSHRCECSNLPKSLIEEYLREKRPYVIRFKMPQEDIIVKDVILGEIRFPKEELEDFIIIKSDGFPTYHLAVVVDDFLMDITHIIRGQEHLMNTPKHIALQRAFNIPSPIYAHVPLIFNMDGSKMSKRDKEKALKMGKPIPEIDVCDFRDAGYLPEALLNFIALLGWSPGGDKEFMDINEMIELFSLDRINKSNARFDREKLLAFNAHYIKTLPEERLIRLIKDYADKHNYPIKNATHKMLSAILELYRPRAKTLKELCELSAFFFKEKIEYDKEAIEKVLNNTDAQRVLVDIKMLLDNIPDAEWQKDTLEKIITGYCEQKAFKLKKVAQPIRVAISGSTVSPPLFETLELLGKKKTLDRIKTALDLIKTE